MIQFSNLRKSYSLEQDALSDINLKIQPGEFVFITGHSGAGKSTLLRLLATLEKPTQGTITIGKKCLNDLTVQQIPFFRRRLGIIFQNAMLLGHYSIFYNVALPLIIAGFSSQDIQKRVFAALERVGLREKAIQKPMSLSTGEQQRVGIARAVVHKPSILLADEPTGNLDPQLSHEIITLFSKFNQVGVTVLIATHDEQILEQFPYRTLKLDTGRLIKDTQALTHAA